MENSPIDRLPEENGVQYEAFIDYALSGLSYDRLITAYCLAEGETGLQSDAGIEQVIRWVHRRAAGGAVNVPTKRKATLSKWGATHHWQARREAFFAGLAADRALELQAAILETEDAARRLSWRILEGAETALAAAIRRAESFAGDIGYNITREDSGVSVDVTAGADVAALRDVMGIITAAMDELRRALRMPKSFSAGALDVTSAGAQVGQPSAELDLSKLPAELIRELSGYLDEGGEDE